MDWERRQDRILLQQRQQQRCRYHDHNHDDDISNTSLPPPPSAPALALQQARALSLTSLKTVHVGVWSALAALYSCIGDLTEMTAAMQR